MSRNGAGIYTLNTAGQPVVNGTTITDTAFNAAMTDIATALTQSICTDGQSTTTAAIPFAGGGVKTDTLAPVTASGPISFTAGQILFPASQNASSNPNVLDDYEEGTWTPIDSSGAGLVFTAVNAGYYKIGSLVVARGTLTYPATADGSTAVIGGLPFATINNDTSQHCMVELVLNNNFNLQMSPVKNGTTINVFRAPTGAAPAALATNANLTLTQIYFTAIYPAAN